MKNEALQIGIAGIGGRPAAFLHAIQNSNKAALTAVCDISAEVLDGFTYVKNPMEKYADYDQMLQKAGLDLVVVGTPMPFHASQSVGALAENIHVLSEVTAAVTLDEAMALVQACKNSKAQYMMAENCCYMKPYMIVAEMVRLGAFGGVFYASGEYLHDCRNLLEKTLWRRELLKRGGITYGTHNLGPILSWFEGDRVEKVMCAGSGCHVKDQNGRFVTTDDTAVMLAKTAAGRLIHVRTEFCSHPYVLNFKLQGTERIYDASLKADGFDRVHTEGAEGVWEDISAYEEQYLPEIWRRYGEVATAGGHGGSDYILMADVIDALHNGRPVPIGIHRSMDMTLPGIISGYSVENGGEWTVVPDSREW